MRSSTLITALLLCSLSSVSGSESQTVKVQSGDEVTLTCTDISSSRTLVEWFRLINRTKPSCISSMYGFDGKASFCDGFKKGFEMSSNKSTVFLKIKQVDLSDSGLYFCGFYKDAHIVIADATHLIVQGWISASGSEYQTVKVQSGDEVTLTCTNITRNPTQTEWFKLTNRTKPSCISSMYGSDGEAAYCVGFKKGFEMSSKKSTVFLKIKRVDLSDSGLYFCGFYTDIHTVIANATHLIVQGDGESDGEVDSKTEKESDGTANLISLILGGLTVSLTIVVVVLAVKVRKRQTAVNEEPQPERNKNLGSDELNSAALRFLPETIRNRRPASDREVETCVVYAASR